MNTTQNTVTNTKVKDCLFRKLFSEKGNLLELYNALTGKHYTEKDDLRITTLEDVIYISLKNDLSFMIDANLNLFEHQSTLNPNMPVRGLLYFGNLYRSLLVDENLYGTKLVKLPTPHYIVFYNGDSNAADRTILRLSDAYEQKEDHVSLEVEVIMININHGHNEELMKQCEVLRGYSILIDKIKQYSKEEGLPESVDHAINECIKAGVLADFLRQRKSEVKEVILTEYDAKKTMEAFRKEGYEDGMIDGKAEVILYLLSDCGEPSEELKNQILKEKDLTLLEKWIKIAAKVSTIEEFLQKYQQ